MKSLKLASLLLLFSCASNVETLTPVSSFITPRAQGKLKLAQVIAHQLSGSSVKVVVNEDGSDQKTTLVKSQNAAGATGQVGIHRYIDFILRLGTHAPHQIGIKAQFIGENKLESEIFLSKHSLSFFGLIGQYRYKGTDSNNFGIISSSLDYKIERTHTTSDLGLIYGYHYSKYNQIYLNYIQKTENIHSNIEWEGKPINQTQVDLQGAHSLFILGHKYEFKGFIAMIEFAWNQVAWNDNLSENFTHINIGAGKTF